jgi:hypothetical protein
MAYLNIDRKVIGDAIMEVTTKLGVDNAMKCIGTTLTYGDVYAIPFITGSTVNSWAGATGYAGTSMDTNAVSTTLNKHFFTQVDLTDDQMAKMTPQGVATEIAHATQRLLGTVLSASCALFTNATFTTHCSTSASAFTAASALAALDAESLNIPGPKFLIANSTLWGYLGQNAQYVNASTLGSANFAQNGDSTLPVYGWSTIKTGLSFPANVQGMLVNRNAMGIVSGLKQPPESAANTRFEVFDLPSGLRIAYRDFYNDVLGKQVRVVEWVGGISVLDPAAGVCVNTTP